MNAIFSGGYSIGLVVLALGVLFPRWSGLAVLWLVCVPLGAALYVGFSSYHKDKTLAISAILAVVGVMVVFLLKSFLS